MAAQTDLVDRVAEAMREAILDFDPHAYTSYWGLTPDARDRYRRMAEAAITAMGGDPS